jgi:hypothetical protein
LNLKRARYFVATGYRGCGCISKWHDVEKGRVLNETEIDIVVALIMGWIEPKIDEKSDIAV